MPVYIKSRIRKGWKKTENDRKGPAMVWIFCDEKTNKELFHYAPNLVDKAFFTKGFDDLKVLDELNKALDTFTNGINTSQTTKDWNNTCRLKSEEEKEKK